MAYTRIVRSGDQVEVYEYEKGIEYLGYNGKRKKRKKRVDRDDSERRLRRVDNLRRLRRDFVRLVRANLNGVDKPALITLTMLEVVGVKSAYSAFSVFTKNLRAVYGKSPRYIAVPEFQKRGAVHFHVLIWGLPEKCYDLDNGKTTTAGDLRESGNRSVQHLWQRGFADSLLTNGSDKLAGYLAKYMQKAVSDIRLSGQKAFTASRNVMRPVLSKIGEEFDDVREFYINNGVIPLQDRSFDTQWLGKGRYRLYKINS